MLTKTKRLATGSYLVQYHIGYGLYSGLTATVSKIAGEWITALAWDGITTRFSHANKQAAISTAQEMIEDEARSRRQAASR